MSHPSSPCRSKLAEREFFFSYKHLGACRRRTPWITTGLKGLAHRKDLDRDGDRVDGVGDVQTSNGLHTVSQLEVMGLAEIFGGKRDRRSSPVEQHAEHV